MGRRRVSLLACLIATAAGHAPAAAGPFDAEFHAIAVAEDRRAAGRDELPPFLAHPEAEVRRRALLALGRLQDPATVGWAAPLLGDREAAVREMAAFALGQTADSSAVSALAAALADPAAPVREASAEALGKLACAAAVPPLLDAAERWDGSAAGATLAGEAWLALARLGRVPTLADRARLAAACERALASPAPEIRWRAAYAIERIHLTPQPEDPAPPPSLVGTLEARLRDDEPMVRLSAVRAWGVLGPAGEADRRAAAAAPLLAEADRRIPDTDWRVGVEAARALGRIGGATARGHLAGSLMDWRRGDAEEPPSLRHRHAAALEALAQTAPPEEGVSDAGASDAVRDYLAHPAPGLRWRAAEALVHLDGARAAPAVFGQLVADGDWTARARIATALGAALAPAAPLLLEALGREPEPRAWSGYAAGLAATADSTARPALRRLLEAEDYVAVAVAAEGLGELGDAGAVPLLAATLRRREGVEWAEARHALVGGLAKLGGEEAVAALRDAARDPDEFVSREAGEALAALGLAPEPLATPAPAPRPPSAYPPDFGLDAPWKRATVRTSRGDIVVAFASDPFGAPATVRNFADLASRGWFDGGTFHRVVPDFVIQDGCDRGDGWGGPPYRIRCEYNRRRYTTGALGMALWQKDTGGSQWFITHAPQPRLDGRYTIFGEVERGQEIVDAVREGDRIEAVILHRE